ncbi:AMP-binding protein [Solirubrobacter ginsenosidimutans]|uniref:AMP-binding protein n=1 Tax=Solirubrobacter ginsenosidimutans TaxID=490573 RepID=A0A9X3MY45_9ACTN|nr:AMP-binding protein [Solirubrobacter ginsenosidimutans]MDA0163766.1 AMP-binding protein [Solirubrobacter ginsenosidimutans]
MHWLERADPNWTAVQASEETLTYGELFARASAAAESLRGAERVAIALEPGLDFAVALHACLLAGAAAVPVDLREPSPRLAGASIVIDAPLPTTPSRRAPRRAAPPALSTPALVVHTSGTTGTPRPVVLTLGQILHNALACAVALGHDRHERWLCPLPLSHVGGLMVLLRSAIYGTTAVLGPADRTDITIASLVPTQLGRLLDRDPPPSLRVVMLGGAPADPTLLTRARDAGWPVAPTYGLTQACSAVTVAEVGDTETSGQPLAGLSVTIASDGEIVVDGPTVSGRLETGDLGELDERGRLRVLGRKVDTIVSGGENVMPSEVEAALLAHPAVAEAGVFGRPDAEWGEAVTAHVVLRTPLEPGELRDFAATRLARFKIPKTIEPVPSLPRNASGKLLRRELR